MSHLSEIFCYILLFLVMEKLGNIDLLDGELFRVITIILLIHDDLTDQ